MFGMQLKNSIVKFYTDNKAVCFIIRDLSSKNEYIIHYLRKLIVLLMLHNIDLRAEHVPGVNNVLCDRISRFQVTEDLLHQNSMDEKPLVIPDFLQPKQLDIEKIICSDQV